MTFLWVRVKHHDGSFSDHSAEVVYGALRPIIERPLYQEREPTDEELATKYGVDLNNRTGHYAAHIDSKKRQQPAGVYDRIDWLRAVGTEYDKIIEQVGTEEIPENDDRAVWIVTDSYWRLVERPFYEIVDPGVPV